MNDLLNTTTKGGGPVECLGQTFPSDDARRDHFLTLLAEKLKDPAFRAQEGFPVPEWTAGYWAGGVDYLRTDETAAKTYLPGDRAPKVGEVFRVPALGDAFELIARGGRDAFYKGPIARSAGPHRP